MENFTNLAQQALQQASELAIKRDASELTPWTLLEILINQSWSPVKPLLRSLLSTWDHKLDDLLKQVTSHNTSQPSISGTSDFALSRNLQVILVKADAVASELNSSSVSTEHLLLALMQYDTSIAELMKNYNITTQNIIDRLQSSEWLTETDDRSREELLEELETLAIDITAQALEGKLDPIIWRDEEIRRTMQILSRRTKNNPVLVWDPWVGKTALVEWLAQLIVAHQVPDTLQDKKIFELRIWDLMSGTQYRGAFEEKIKQLLEIIDKLSGEVILFIDELHTIVWAGKTEGSADLGNMLKPALARGRLRVIWATTLSEYRQYIEKDAALERRFQPVLVDEPQRDDAISILRGIKPNYERFHGVKISDDAVVAAVDLSTKYIADRFLPDKAIDLMDEATAAVKMDLVSEPRDISELTRQISNLEVEKEAISIEWEAKLSDKQSKRLDDIETKLADLKERHKALLTTREQERSLLVQSKDLKERLAQLEHEAQRAEQSTDYNKVAELRYGQIPALQSELDKTEAAIEQDRQEGNLAVNDVVSADDIARVIARWTWIPAEKLVEKDIDKLNNLNTRLSEHVIGQSQAVHVVSAAIRRSRAWLQDPEKPTWSFIFAGPTWVGKTELAKSLAEYLFNDRHALIRLDMSEYMEKHTVSKLIGSPPGYIGHEEWGQLTEAVRRKPYSVLLFDEIEKAHPDVFNMFLQILDDGRLTDSKWRTVNFKNTIIIMTTNLWSELIMEKLKNHDTMKPSDYNKAKTTLEDGLLESYTQHFRPEFLNRIDDVIVFDPLSRETLRSIVDLQLGQIVSMLESDKHITLSFSDKAKNQLTKLGYDPLFWARPLKRVIQRHILDPLALALISGEIKGESSVEVNYDGKRFCI